LAPDPLAENDDDGDGGENGDDDDAGGIVVTAMRDEDDENTPENTPLASPCVIKSPAPTNPTTSSPPDGAPEPVRHWWAPPLSPFGLLEEILWQDEWKLLVACMMLNCTTRLQVDRVLWRLFLIAPTAADAVRVGSTPSGFESLERVIAPLGLHRKRTNAFIKLSIDVEAQRASNAAGRKISNVSACHGVGVYASDAHALFVDGVLAGSPRDHALRWYHAWAIERRSRKSARM
jgi:methyl-CpG-binding domain protein 4